MGQKILPTLKSKQTSTCLEIHFCNFRCRAVQVSQLKMTSNELLVLEKPLVLKP